jgi:hypothetical protein
MVAMLGMGWALAACGSSSTHTPSAGSSASPSASVTVGGPCASVKTTTAIVDVPPACAALWAPYQVTKVPPPDILQREHVPLAPPVKNMTNGAVSDADAQLWANASNRDSGWYRWAEANDQPAFLRHLVGAAVTASATEQEALAAGAVIQQPPCNLYPIENALYIEGADGAAYFARKHLPADDYLFVVVYSGPCSEVIVYPDGRTSTVQVFAQPTTVFVPGSLRHDRVLGDIWFGDAGGNCQDPAGPPPQWCGR